MVRVVIIVDERSGNSLWVQFSTSTYHAFIGYGTATWTIFDRGLLAMVIWWRKSNNLSLLSSTSDDVAANYFSEDWKYLWYWYNCCTLICGGTLTVDSNFGALHGLLFTLGPSLAFLAFLASKPVWMDFSLMVLQGSSYFFIFIFLRRCRSHYSVVWNGRLCRCWRGLNVG